MNQVRIGIRNQDFLERNDIDFRGYLRAFGKGRNIRNIVVIGGSFIATETAGSLKSDYKDSNITLFRIKEVFLKILWGKKLVKNG